MIGVPDYNPRIKKINGRLWPVGFLRLLSKRGLKRLCVASLTVAPEYQRWGLGLALLRALLPRALELGFQEAEFSWISETNTLALGGMRKAGLRRGKTYRIYDFGQAATIEQDERKVDHRTQPVNGQSAQTIVTPLRAV